MAESLRTDLENNTGIAPHQTIRLVPNKWINKSNTS